MKTVSTPVDVCGRVLLKVLDGQLQWEQDDSDRASMEIQSVAEYHKGRASAFAQARKLVRRLDVAARAVRTGR